MKKLMLLSVACCFTAMLCLVTAGCNNQPKEEETTATAGDSATVAETPAADTATCEKECCEMMEAWKEWENQTAEKKAELVAKGAEKINEIIAHVDEIKCEKRKAEIQAFKEKWAGFEKITDIEAQKALIDQFPVCKGDKSGNTEEKNCENQNNNR